MTRRKSILGVLCFSALCFSVFGASNASALTMHECKKAASGETTVEYTNSVCSVKAEPPAKGEFRTVPLPLDTFTSIKVTETESFTLSSTVVGIKFKLTCSKAAGTGEAANQTVGGVMQVTGKKAITSFTGCEVKEPVGKGCKVTEPITTLEANSVTKEDKTIFTPVNAEGKFTTITIAGCEGAAAPLNGAKPVTGTASGENNPATPTTTDFTATSGSSLKLAGQVATLTGKAHGATAADGVTISLKTP